MALRNRKYLAIWQWAKLLRRSGFQSTAGPSLDLGVVGDVRVALMNLLVAPGVDQNDIARYVALMLGEHSQPLMHILSPRRFKQLTTLRTSMMLLFKQSFPNGSLVNEILVNRRQF